MTTWKRAIVLGATLLTLFGFVNLASPSIVTHAASLTDSYGKLPLYFVENRGQMDPRVAYYVQGSDKTLYFTPEGMTLSLVGQTANGSLRDNQRWILKLGFVGANSNVQPVGEAPTPAVISYFRGVPAQWKTGLGTFSRVMYRNLWEGIDLVYSGTVDRLKYEFIVKPGADPSQIKLAYQGASSVIINTAGQLEVTTPLARFHDDTPYAYQDIGSRVQIQTAYALEQKGAEGMLSYGFSVGNYDTTKPLVIDPAMLVYAGFIGGSGEDRVQGIVVDGGGNAYVTGVTNSTDGSFPANVGPALTHSGVTDAFVAKLKVDGTGLVYAGFIGGDGEDQGIAIAVDNVGNAYVTGNTITGNATFPVLVGPDLTFNGGGNGDAFVAKVNATGTALVYSGYIGGSAFDQGNAIAVDSAGNAYVAGSTGSNESSFPVSAGPDVDFNGDLDGFVAKVRVDGTALDYAGYVGGSGRDSANGVAVDSGGNAYVGGTTSSGDFPTAVGPDLSYNGGDDVFIAKVASDGSALLYSGFIGGSGNDPFGGVAVDSAGNAYIAGTAGSDESTFPVAVGPDLTYNGGVFDAFVAKVNSSGGGLDYAGYIGGSGYEEGHGIGIDSAQNVYISGFTESTEATFPVAVGPDLSFNGGSFDAFVAGVKADGTTLIYAGYVGGNGDEFSYAGTADSAGNAYLGGLTTSTESSFPVTAGPGLTNGGGYDGFVAKVGEEQPPVEDTPNARKQQVLAELQALYAATTNKQDRERLDETIKHVNKSLDPSLWANDGAHLQANGEKVFSEEKDAVNKLREIIKDKKTTLDKPTIQGLIDELVAVDRALAALAIADAAGGDANKLARANSELAKGDADVSSGKYDSGIEHYRNAWKKAREA